MELTGILFNHDPGSTQSSALNIRRNFLQTIDRPEWTPGKTLHAHSIAAYAVNELDFDDLRVFARFSAPEFAGKHVEVATARPDVPDLPNEWQDALNTALFLAPALYLQWRNFLNVLWTYAYETNDDVLGVIAPTTIRFDSSGDSDWVPLSLTNHLLQSAGVGRHNIAWQWLHRPVTGGPWLKIEETRHTIYTVLETPKLPWRQEPFTDDNTQLPWSDALDKACEWATGAMDVDAAAAQVTRTMFGLGGTRFRYGCEIGAVTVYAVEPFFNLTKALERLSGAFGLGEFVNCSDCATFVSTFANLLGADLWQSQMRSFERGFPVNPIRAIGDRAILPPCGIGVFNYHEVAWDGQATEDDAVYDACLEVDTDTGFFEFNMLLPTGLRFGAAGDGQYRDLLAAPFGRRICEPQPQLKLRRFVF